MASVTLEQAWFHDADDFATSVQADLTAATEQAERSGDVRLRANGNLVLVSGPARPANLDVELSQCPRTVVDQLRLWVGKRLLYRDPRGRVEFVTFLSLTVVELAAVEDVANVSMGMQRLSGTVAV